MPTEPAPPPLDYRNPTHHATPARSPRARRILAWPIGIFCLVAILIAFLLPTLGRPRETALRIWCASNLKQIGAAALLYANENHGLLPPDLCTIQSYGKLSPRTLICPSHDLDPPSGTTPAAIKASILSGDHLAYAWVGAGLSLDRLDNDVILAFDLERHKPDSGLARTTGINVLLADGSADFVTDPTAKAIFAQFAAGIRPIRLPASATSAANANTQPVQNP